MKRPDAALRARRDALAAQLAEGLAAEAPLAELRDTQARLALVDGVLAAARGPAWRPQVAAVVVVAALVSLAALLPMPRVSFALELEADAAQLRMADKGSLAGDALGGELRAEGFDRLESADAQLVQRARDSGAGQLALQAERLVLRRISFPAGAELGFEAGERAVRLAVDGRPHAADIELAGKVSTSFAGAPRQAGAYAVAEWIRLVSESAPSELWLARVPERSLVWRGLRPESLRLLERQVGADGQVRRVSALRQASLRLPETERELKLAAGSGLELDGLRLDQAELMLGDRVALKMAGSARRMVVHGGGFTRSLKPSVLDYAAHNHTLALLWSTAGLLWGIGAWLRKQFGAA